MNPELQIPFMKYHGTGNDFVIIDQRKTAYIDANNQALIAGICHRRFGVGADGLMLIQHSEQSDFQMHYFNADGAKSSMCGNGGRCIVAAAIRFGVVQPTTSKVSFEFGTDIYHAQVDLKTRWIQLKMQDVSFVKSYGTDYVLDTGSPHYVQFLDDLQDISVYDEGKAIRNSPDFVEKGINVNFCILNADRIVVKTYERGVEDETYSCGTGVTAAAIAAAIKQNRLTGKHVYQIETLGGKLRVEFEQSNTGFSNIFLEGPTKFVFEGKYNIR